MIDIVESLRARRVRGRPGFYNPDELCQQAANEIDRLRRFLIEAFDTLEAIDSEIVLIGHLKEMVDCALAPRMSGLTGSSSMAEDKEWRCDQRNNHPKDLDDLLRDGQADDIA